MLKIRRPLGRLIFNMGIAIPGKTVFLIETAPWSIWRFMVEITRPHQRQTIIRFRTSKKTRATDARYFIVSYVRNFEKIMSCDKETRYLFRYKNSFFRVWDFHYKDKRAWNRLIFIIGIMEMVVRPSYLYNPYTVKTTSLYWDGTQAVIQSISMPACDQYLSVSYLHSTQCGFFPA